jgi:3-hydroxy acid dehydrogenase/malonic semialdehyde reductase
MNQETILISGATSGIGEACARLFARAGRKLILTGRRSDRLKIIGDEISKTGADVYTAVFDIRNRSEVEAFVNDIPEAFRSIRVLLNNAGLAAGMEPLQEGNPDDWDRMIDTNIKGLLYLTHAIIPLMKSVEGAQIVNLGSVAGKEVYPSGNVYSGSKHAVDAITRSMRIDLLPMGIRVSTVSPGLVETEFSVVRFHGDDERAKKVYQGIDPLTGADIAECVRYIIEAPYRITIADIVVMPDRQGSSRDVRRGS